MDLNLVDRPDIKRGRKDYHELWAALEQTIGMDKAIVSGPINDRNSVHAYNAMQSRTRYTEFKLHSKTVNGMRHMWLEKRRTFTS